MLDPGYDEFLKDRAFDLDPERYPGTRTWSLLRDRLRVSGVEIHTIDVAAERGPLSGCALLSHGFTKASERAIGNGACGAAVFCWESPLIAWAFYHRLGAISALYSRAFLFPGALRRARSRLVAEPMMLPQPRRPPAVHTAWADRAFLAVINSTASLEPVSLAQFIRSAVALVRRRERTSLRRQLTCLVDSELRQELYSTRFEAIRYFGSREGFSLYGRGWDRIGGDPALVRAVERSYRGAPADKDDVLGAHRFALAFENAAFSGYMTDRIVACFAAGTIPVYLGAPDARAYVPADAFVDARRYSSFSALDSALRAMTPTEGEDRLAAAREFLSSPAFDLFDERVAADRLTRASLDALA